MLQENLKKEREDHDGKREQDNAEKEELAQNWSVLTKNVRKLSQDIIKLELKSGSEGG